MPWDVLFHDAFDAEFEGFPEDVREELLARAGMLQEFGPSLGRPAVDTLNSSKHDNMKELRFRANDGVWRVAFAFDPKRNAILLTAGDKSGVSEERFYKRLIKKADDRFDSHLGQVKKELQKAKGK